MKAFRILIGLAVWVALGAGLGWYVDRQLVAGGGIQQTLAPALWEYAAGRRQTVELRAGQPLVVAVGDPIFLRTGPESFRQVGEIRQVVDPDQGRPASIAWVTSAEALLYSSAPALGDEASLSYYTTEDSLVWVVQTMLPPEKQREIAVALSAAFHAHKDEIIAELRPIVEESVRDAMLVVEQDLSAALVRHRPELEKLGSRYQRELVEKEIIPLVKEEIWPSVRQRAEPMANEIGLELWERVSIWRFGWRALHDITPFTKRDMVSEEWQRFVNQEAFPIVQTHTDDFVRVTKEILTDAARNPKVRATARKNMLKILEDEELQKIVWALFREVVVDNPRLKEVFDEHWRSPKAQRAFRIASDRLEPTVRHIGDLLIGTRETGITPEFAQVLRNQVLHKDRRWFVLEVAPEATSGSPANRRAPTILPIRRGTAQPGNPFVPL